MQKWEYKIISQFLEEAFNKLGAEGWELVGIAMDGSLRDGEKAVFKRRKL